jgi:hypothetical protein
MQEIVASELTPDDVGDGSEIPALLDQIDARSASTTVDGTYDGEAVYDAVAKCRPEAAMIIPPRATAVPNESTTTQRDRHIAEIEKHGRMNWQRRSGYNRQSLVETAMYRYKTVVGRRLHARTLPNQQTEAKIRCNVLNRMTTLDMPATIRIRWCARQERRHNQRSIHVGVDGPTASGARIGLSTTKTGAAHVPD